MSSLTDRGVAVGRIFFLYGSRVCVCARARICVHVCACRCTRWTYTRVRVKIVEIDGGTSRKEVSLYCIEKKNSVQEETLDVFLIFYSLFCFKQLIVHDRNIDR